MNKQGQFYKPNNIDMGKVNISAELNKPSAGVYSNYEFVKSPPVKNY
jgi:hypothetical protein